MTTSDAARGMRGAIVWAFTGFQPEAPFTVWQADGTTLAYPSSEELAAAVRNEQLDNTPRFLVQAKLRPVVLLQERPRGALPEYAALKLARFTKLAPAKQQGIRDRDERALFYLPHNERKYGLKQEKPWTSTHWSGCIARSS